MERCRSSALWLSIYCQMIGRVILMGCLDFQSLQKMMKYAKVEPHNICLVALQTKLRLKKKNTGRGLILICRARLFFQNYLAS